MDVCLRVLKESNKSRFDSYSVRNSVLIISHITFRDCRVHIFPTFLEIAVHDSDESLARTLENSSFYFFLNYRICRPVLIFGRRS